MPSVEKESDRAEVFKHSEIVPFGRGFRECVGFERVGNDEREGGGEWEDGGREFRVEGEMEKLAREAKDGCGLLGLVGSRHNLVVPRDKLTSMPPLTKPSRCSDLSASWTMSLCVTPPVIPFATRADITADTVNAAEL